jgi:1,2-diacylglycerol 3-beta-galactosyltransferase
MKVTTEFSIRKRISSCYPDVVISVHPLMNVAPVIACQKISSETGKHIPFFTVVTDLGSCHYTWFDKGVEKIFVASKQIRDLAKKMLVPEKKIVMSGLPIRADFSTQAERLGPCGRISMQGKIYQMQTRDQLGIVRGGLGNFDSIMDGHKVVLVMGGGEGVGSLYSIVESLYLELAQKDVMATIMVICGRNEKLKAKLQDKDWEDMLLSLHEKNAKLAGFKGKKSLPYNLFDRLHIGRNTENGEEKKDGASAYGSEPQPKVLVHPLGFVTNMAEYMVASDVLVTKAGPGTIAEAAAVGLPVMLTSFLPGKHFYPSTILNIIMFHISLPA